MKIVVVIAGIVLCCAFFYNLNQVLLNEELIGKLFHGAVAASILVVGLSYDKINSTIPHSR